MVCVWCGGGGGNECGVRFAVCDCDVGTVVKHRRCVGWGVDLERVVADVAHTQHGVLGDGGRHFDFKCEVGDGDHVVRSEVIDRRQRCERLPIHAD